MVELVRAASTAKTITGPVGLVGLEHVTPKRAFLIGLGQCVSMWPGSSRSMCTIVAGQLTGLSTATAAEFSFLLGLPTLGAATVYEAYKSRAALGGARRSERRASASSSRSSVAWAVIAAFLALPQEDAGSCRSASTGSSSASVVFFLLVRGDAVEMPETRKRARCAKLALKP